MRAKLAPCLIMLGLLVPAFAFAAAENKEPEKGIVPTAAELKKFDLNKDGKLDEAEMARLLADRAERYKQALAKYDANHNGKLDPDELAKMQEDEELAAKTAREAAEQDQREGKRIMRAEAKRAAKPR